MWFLNVIFEVWDSWLLGNKNQTNKKTTLSQIFLSIVLLDILIQFEITTEKRERERDSTCCVDSACPSLPASDPQILWEELH